MRRELTALVALAAASVVGACASSDFVDEGLVGLEIRSVEPGVAVEGTVLSVRGASFVDSGWGASVLRLQGGFTGDGGEQQVDVSVPARFVDFDHMEVDVERALFDAVGGEGDFVGDVSIEVTSLVDSQLYQATPIQMTLSLRDQLEPRLDTAQTGGLIFVNDPIEVAGGGLLLGGNEGQTYAVVQGCFTPMGQTTCTQVGPLDVPVVPATAFDRERGHFAFVPEIAGISPGTFDGTVTLRNDHGVGGQLSSASKSVAYELIEPAIFSASPTSASLGQYVDIDGGGFVGGKPGADTLLHLVGTFTPTGAPAGGAVDLLLVPEFFDGRRVRYVINEDDALGQALDLRKDTGTFVGTLTPEIAFGGDRVVGSSTQMTLSIAPVKQVLYVRFEPSYVESLRHFGLRAVDALIRQRVADTVTRDYRTINVEVRIEQPTDFALYSEVEIGGPDPNGLGLFGYDNTPGKDVGNERLYDRIGGVNASTQEDGYPGYGGVFIESFFGFSEHPEGRAESLSGADPAFDVIFDPFRPDRGGTRVAAADLSGGVARLDNGDSCPAEGSRADKIACAVFVLGSLIGTTVSHEIGHSFGLANPYGEGFHYSSDERNRIMDAGGARPFSERAELYGDGPAQFCDEAYRYLRELMPTNEPEDLVGRPTCF